jgi:hypothetical protein
MGVAPDASASVNDAVDVTSWGQFKAKFCPKPRNPTDPAIKPRSTPLAQAVYGFFANGGRRCYVVNIGTGSDAVLGGADDRKGVDVLETLDDVNIVAAPGYTDTVSHNLLIDHCEKMKDRVAILDPPKDVSDIGLFSNNETAPAPGGAGTGGGQPGGGGSAPKGVRPKSSAGGYATIYFPWITGLDPFDPNPNAPIEIPPSGHIAGVWARTDALRGVHKAPANEAIAGCMGLTYSVSQSEQEVLNPLGVNCIRAFARDGILIWGARTLTKSSDWTYINVRRLFNMIEESIRRSTRWVVFEPNDQSLWKAIKRDVTAFLRLLWSDGMLLGTTEEKAFYVKCDEETNPPESIDLGYVVIEVGIAPVKPAEFVVFQIGQYSGGSEKSES